MQNEKWRKREEQRELARLAELKAQMQRKVKVFMCAVTMASRLRHLALALHRGDWLVARGAWVTADGAVGVGLEMLLPYLLLALLWIQ